MAVVSRIWSVALAPLLAGCMTTVEVERAIYVNGLDPRPRMDVEAALGGRIAPLAPADAVVVARGNARQVVAPQPVTLRIVQMVDAGGRSASAAEAEAAAQASAERPRFVVHKYIENEQGQWAQARTITLNASTPAQFMARFRLIIVNAGGAAFQGEIEMRDRLPQGLVPLSDMTARRIVDNRDARMALSMIPYIGLIALAIDDFSVREAVPASPSISPDGTITVRVPQVLLPPGEGVVLEFGAQVPRPPPL